MQYTSSPSPTVPSPSPSISQFPPRNIIPHIPPGTQALSPQAHREVDAKSRALARLQMEPETSTHTRPHAHQPRQKGTDSFAAYFPPALRVRKLTSTYSAPQRTLRCLAPYEGRTEPGRTLVSIRRPYPHSAEDIIQERRRRGKSGIRALPIAARVSCITWPKGCIGMPRARKVSVYITPLRPSPAGLDRDTDKKAHSG